ncbi:MAG: FAD binding domain-containing protein [Polyangiaceae bacterium]|nr:FAD binding domain-containing protein [Polyangiaceae bacterium]
MKEFHFHRASSVADAVAAVKGASAGKFLAGGQSLLPVLKLEMAEPSDLVSISRIKELRGVCVDGNKLLIGAVTTHAEVAASSEVKKHIPGLAALAEHIGDAQVRNRGTIGGSVAHADPAADYPAALVALGATIKTDRRAIAAEDFFTGLFETALEPDELVVAVHFPIPEKSAYAKFASHASKYALCGVMVSKTGSDVRVAVTGAGQKVFRVPEMEKALAARFEPSALDGISISADDLLSDGQASAEYRAHLVTVMAKRAVAAA